MAEFFTRFNRMLSWNIVMVCVIAHPPTIIIAMMRSLATNTLKKIIQALSLPTSSRPIAMKSKAHLKLMK